jgi:hypothetical protein
VVEVVVELLVLTLLLEVEEEALVGKTTFLLFQEQVIP